MNLPLLQAPFELPKDGWYPGLMAGEYPIQLDVDPATGLSQFGTTHTQAIQVIDAASLASLTATPTTSPEILIDYDHESLDLSKRTEAAGWIQQFKVEHNELFFQPRWSDTGAEAVKGGRYRYVSFVWKPSQCEIIESTPALLKVRPLKIFNAGLTNNPNMRGIPPLSNRENVVITPPRAAAVPKIAVSNRSAVHFVRGFLLANGMYCTPRTESLTNRTLSQKQIRYLHWMDDQGGAGGGSGSGSKSGARNKSGSSGDTGTGGNNTPLMDINFNGDPTPVVTQTAAMPSPSADQPPPADTQTAATPPDAADATLAALTQNYDAAQNENSNIKSLADQYASPPTPDTPAPSYDPVRDTAARIKAIETQRDALIAQRPAEPKKPDYTPVDLRKLERDLMKQGKGTNEIRKAVDDAKAENDRKKHALDAIKKQIRAAYPNNFKKQTAALKKYMDQQDAQYQKQHDAWSKVNAAIDKAVVTANKMIEDEKIRGDEATKAADQKKNNADYVTAQKAATQQARAVQKQVEADKADARRKAAADEKAQRAASKPQPTVDSVTAMSRELRRRKFYWQSLARGETDAAKMLYPEADTEKNMKTVQDLAAGVKSKNDEKAHQKALAKLAQEAP